MLDVHPAHHAATSWREFFTHIATIVVGLLIAVGLEQTVELIHRHHELLQVRRELSDEREANHKALAKEAACWRWETVELQNNLMVLQYLRQHPGTPDDALPGALIWSYVHEPHREAVWDAAKADGATSLMSREEVEQYEDLYNKLRAASDAVTPTWEALTSASRYQFTDSRLQNLTPAQIGELITLTETALDKQWLLGVDIENVAAKYSDFAPSLTPADLAKAHNRDSWTYSGKNPAFAKSLSRMEAAGFGR